MDGQNINMNVQVNIAQAKQQIELLSKQMRTLKVAYEQAYRSDTKTTMFKGASTSAEELQKNIRKVSAEIQQLSSSMYSGVGTYAQQLRNAALEAQRLHQVMLATGSAQDRLNFNNAVTQFRKLTETSQDFNKQLGIANQRAGYLGSLGQKIRSHFNWILAGSLLAAFAAIPAAVENITRETEVLGLKIKQNLELVEKYQKDHGALANDIKHLSEVAGVFAVGYGANVEDVMEMMQILSRRFKSPEELTYYTNLALVMHKLDFVAPKQAAENLESVILSMGLDFKQARQFIDEFSVAVHTARITGTDLLLALQRSGATFKNMNFNTAESIAMISALSTVVAKSGQNIGVSLNSILTNIDFKKGAAALKAYGIEVYDAMNNNEMRQGVEIWRDIARVFNGLDDKKANEFALAMSGGKFRINDLKAIVSTWGEFEKILNEINTKASPEMTAVLLQTGLESYETKLKRLSASLQVFGMTIGNEVLPALKDLVAGLTAGIMWLNDNREAVAGVVQELTKAIGVILTWKLGIIAGNIELKTLNGTMRLSQLLSEGLQGSFRNIGSAASIMARTIGMAAIQLAALYAVAKIGSLLYDEYANKTPEQRNMENEIFQMQKALDDPFIQGDARTRLEGNIANKKAELDSYLKQRQDEQTKAETNKYMDKVNALVTEAEKKMPQHPPGEKYPPVAGEDLGSSSGSSKASSSIPPSDLSSRMAKDTYKTAQDQMFLSAKLSADQYSIALDQLSTKEALYGQTVKSTIEGFNIKQKRLQELANEERKYTNEADYLESILNEQVETNGELQQALGVTIEQWKAMSKEQKAAYKLDRREFLEQLELTKAQTTALNKYREKASEVHKELVKITDELLKQKFAGVYDEDKIRERNLKSIDVDANTQKANLGYNRPMQSFNERAIEYQAELKRYEQYLKYQEQLKQDYDEMKAAEIEMLEEQRKAIELLADSAKKTKALKELKWMLAEARKGNTVALLQLNAAQEENNKNIAISIQKQDQLKDKFFEIRKAWAESIADMVVDGKDGGEILKNLWKDLAKEAIMNMFKVNQYQNLLAQTSGKGKGKSAGGSSGGFSGVRASTASALLPTAFADGGIVKKPTLGLIGEAGEEANINLDKLKAGDSRQAALLNYANTQWNKGDTYVPTFRNPELAKASTTDIKIQQSMEHISELQRANELMMQQNQMLMYMMKNGGNTGGNTVVVAPQSDQQILDVINRNPRAMQGINGRHKSNGFR